MRGETIDNLIDVGVVVGAGILLAWAVIEIVFV